MITIYKPSGEKLGTIPDDDFFEQLSAGELLEAHPEYGAETSDWDFITSSSEIRFRTGKHEKPAFISLDSDVNVSWFKKAWYLAYCESHGYSYSVTHKNGEIERIKAKRIAKPKLRVIHGTAAALLCLFPSSSVTFATDALPNAANVCSKSAHIADCYSVLEDGDLDLEDDEKEGSQ